MLEETHLRDILLDIPLESEMYLVHRCVSARYLQSLASTLGTELEDNRYSKQKTLKGLYAAYQGATATAEVEDYIKKKAYISDKVKLNLSIFTFQLKTENVLDLTSLEILGFLCTNVQEITGNWRMMNEMDGEAPTQMLGRLAYESGRIDAIRYPSRVHHHGVNVLVFTERLGYEIVALDLPDNFPEQL